VLNLKHRALMWGFKNMFPIERKSVLYITLEIKFKSFAPTEAVASAHISGKAKKV
jgi:hypothetical protein